MDKLSIELASPAPNSESYKTAQFCQILRDEIDLPYVDSKLVLYFLFSFLFPGQIAF